MIPGLVTHTLADIGNRLLRLDPESGARLAPLAGKIMLVDCVSPAFRLYLIAGDDSVRVAHQHGETHHVMVRGTLGAFLEMARPGSTLDPAGLRDVLIEGDIETGRRFLALFSNLDIDWEEHASRVVGDVAAHQLGNLVRALNEVGPQAVRALLRDAGEYLQYEARFMPPRPQVAAFLDAVDVIRSDVDRLEQRVRRLQEARS